MTTVETIDSETGLKVNKRYDISSLVAINSNTGEKVEKSSSALFPTNFKYQ
jgi:hypothetical protein